MNALNAPRKYKPGSDTYKLAMNPCRRLRPGFKFNKGGSVSRVGMGAPGLGFFKGLKKLFKSVATVVGAAVGGVVGVAITHIGIDAFDGGGFHFGWKSFKKSIGMGNSNISQSTEVWATFTFEPWIKNKVAATLKGSENPATLTSVAYREKINKALKVLEKFRASMQALDVEKSAVIRSGQELIFRAYVRAMKEAGHDTFIKTIPFSATDFSFPDYPGILPFEPGKKYLTELMVFTDSADGNVANEGSMSNPAEIKPNTPVNHPPKTGGVKPEKAVSRDKFPILDHGPVELPATEDKTAPTPTDPTDEKIFGLPKPIAYLLGGGLGVWILTRK